jgi:predicted metal-dependent phosphotriesterase family hydrolase
MKKIMTVRGEILSSDLGICLSHEHLFVDWYRVDRNPDHWLDHMGSAVDDLKHYKQIGGSSLIDLTNLGLGRDPKRIKQAAELADVNVIMGCGWYREPFYPADINKRTLNDLTEQLIADIENGVDGIRPGVIGEIGADREFVSGVEERVLRAAARAAKHTSLAVITHAIKSRVGLDQLEILKDEGLPLNRVPISHCDSFMHFDYHEGIANLDAYVSFDSNNARNPLTQRLRVEAVLNLVEKGLADRVLLSQDVCKADHRREAGGPGYSYVLEVMIPQLLTKGLTQDHIDKFMVHNPRRLLTGEH